MVTAEASCPARAGGVTSLRRAVTESAECKRMQNLHSSSRLRTHRATLRGSQCKLQAGMVERVDSLRSIAVPLLLVAFAGAACRPARTVRIGWDAPASP